MWPGGPKLCRRKDILPLGTDSVLLASFAMRQPARRILDLGTGSGVIAILSVWEKAGVRADGIELQHHAALAAAENIRLNGLEDRVRILEGDIRKYREPAMAGEYDLVLCNPPYFPVSSGKSSENEKLALAREERSCTLSDVCAAGAYYTKWGGRFALIHRPERLSEVLCTMSASGLEPKRLRFVQNTAESLPSLILAEGRRGGKAGLAIEQPLILTRDGRDTEEIERIYHRKGV